MFLFTSMHKPIVESYGGKYIVRSEKITTLWDSRRPDRLNIIQFPSKEQIFKWLASAEYKEIVNLRTDSVETDAINSYMYFLHDCAPLY